MIVIMVALLQCQFFGLRTGINRPKYGVLPPKTTGNETWERMFRIHQNTVEQMVIFVPALLGFAYYVSHLWAVVLGVLFIIFRQVFSITYMKDPTKRLFPPSFLVNVVLAIGAIIGIVVDMVKSGNFGL
jgi:glutathione S-transferase